MIADVIEAAARRLNAAYDGRTMCEAWLTTLRELEPYNLTLKNQQKFVFDQIDKRRAELLSEALTPILHHEDAEAPAVNDQ